ncbi:MAG: DUF4416 family protein [Anaerolineae bacterium]
MMGKIKEPLPVKLIASMFTASGELLEEAQGKLSQKFGPIDYESELLPFDHTTYYAAEFRENLKRRFVAFEKLVPPGELAEIKLLTNALEMEWAVEGNRRINIDPGYVSHSKLVLATTKNHAHRIYLGQGIYAEVTLHFRDGTFRAWPWTYPDYASPPLIAIFNQIRELYVKQLR